MRNIAQNVTESSLKVSPIGPNEIPMEYCPHRRMTLTRTEMNTWHHSDNLLFTLTKLGVAAIAGPNYPTNMPTYGDVLSQHKIRNSVACHCARIGRNFATSFPIKSAMLSVLFVNLLRNKLIAYPWSTFLPKLRRTSTWPLEIQEEHSQI